VTLSTAAIAHLASVRPELVEGPLFPSFIPPRLKKGQSFDELRTSGKEF